MGSLGQDSDRSSSKFSGGQGLEIHINSENYKICTTDPDEGRVNRQLNLDGLPSSDKSKVVIVSDLSSMSNYQTYQKEI
jgi:hypothetical protein